MNKKSYIFTLWGILFPAVFIYGQTIIPQSIYNNDIEEVKSEFVTEGEGSTANYFEVRIALNPVPEYYAQTFFLNRLLKAEGFYFQTFLSENRVSFYVSRELFSEIPVQLVHDFFDEAIANQNFLPQAAQDEYLSMYSLSLPGKDFSLLSGYRIIQGPLTENALCEDALPFCTGSNYTFPAGVASGSGQNGPNYDCLASTPNPAWYFLKILDPGSIVIYMYSTPSKDIDFCCWGPFDDPYDACSQLTGSKVVDCSYSPNPTETCDIPSGQTGEYYILVITNYSNQACNINFSQTGGSGSTDCTILPPEANSNSPVCEGDNLELFAASQNGASYHWTGPLNFSSTLQNPVIENATTSHTGPYTLTITTSIGSSDTTLMVWVKTHPTGDIYGTAEICEGDNANIFLNLTGDSPWEIKYTDGQNIYQESTFLNAYTLSVSPSVSSSFTLVEVKDEFCYAYEEGMTGEAVVDIHPKIHALNVTTACNPDYTHYTVSFLITGGTSGTYVVNPPGNITPGPNAVFTSNPIPEGTPYQFSITDSFGCDPTVVSGIKDCDCPAYGEIVGEDTLCSGQSTSIRIELSGEAPWNITYTANGMNPVTIDDIDETPYFLTVSPTETTEYQLTYVGDQFCDGTGVGKANVFVHPQPVSQYIYEGICESLATAFTNESSIPNPGNITSWLWDFDDNGATSTDENPQHIFSSWGDFEVGLTVSSLNGCTDEYVQTVSIAQRVDVDAGADQEITYGTSTLLEGSVSGGSGEYTYQWQPEDKVVDPSDPETITTNLYEDTYFLLTVTDQISGCTGTSEVQIALDGYPLSTTPDASPSQACYGSNVQLNANAFGGTGNYSYHWTSDQGHEFFIADPAVESLTQSTTFTVTVDDGYNPSIGNVFVPVNPNPVISAGDDFSVDYGYKTQLECTTSGGGSNFSFFWSPDEMIEDNPYSQTPFTVNLTTQTVFTVSVTNEFGCSTADNVIVSVTGGPLVAAPWIAEEKLCHHDVITLHPGAGGGGGNYAYNWSVSPGTWTSQEAEPVITLDQTGDFTYSVTVSDEFNTTEGSLDLQIHPLPVTDLTAAFDSLVEPGVVAICIFDSVYLDAGNPGAEYLWSNGATTQRIQVGSTGIGYEQQDYSVLITNKDTECAFQSTVSIIYSFSMCTYSIEELNGQSLEVAIAPNPVQGQLRLSVKGITRETKVAITDVSGQQQIFNATLPKYQQEYEQIIDFEDLPSGLICDYIYLRKSNPCSKSNKNSY
ncbi:MAG: PKD domain-containing protein [Bacteroidales bacterium]|nr:PKD domain-containing protein [Bacteroidales bacterium]